MHTQEHFAAARQFSPNNWMASHCRAESKDNKSNKEYKVKQNPPSGECAEVSKQQTKPQPQSKVCRSAAHTVLACRQLSQLVCKSTQQNNEGEKWIDLFTLTRIWRGHKHLEFTNPKIHHQIIQVPNLEVLNLGCLGGCGFPYISRIHTAYIGEDSSILGTWNVWWTSGCVSVCLFFLENPFLFGRVWMW